MVTRKSTSDQVRVKRVTEFLGLGFTDYIGARILLLNGLPLQGAVLGSTSVEKYIKALVSVRGEKVKGHLKSSHLNSLRNYVPKLYEKINLEFFKYLKHCYCLRYTDQLPLNFNIVIYARETLAELDQTIYNMEFQLNFTQSDGQETLTPYRVSLENKDERLLQDNYILSGEDKLTFLKREDIAYTLRNTPELGILSTNFTTFESPQDGKFMRKGLRRTQ